MIWFEKKKDNISGVSEFSILSYKQNRKLGSLGKFSVTSNFDSCCNSRTKIDKNKLGQKL